MTNWKAFVVLAAMASCVGAGNSTMRTTESASGHWSGSIARDGWTRPLSVDLERERDAWRGKWRSLQGAPGLALKDVEVRGDEVRFETDDLRFIGQVMGDTLSGTVVEVPAGAPAGEFSVSREDPVRFVD